jgi:hypothetical protein
MTALGIYPTSLEEEGMWDYLLVYFKEVHFYKLKCATRRLGAHRVPETGMKIMMNKLFK